MRTAVSCGRFETVDLLRPRQWKHCLPSSAAELGCRRQRRRFTAPIVLRPVRLNETPRRNVNKLPVPRGQGQWGQEETVFSAPRVSPLLLWWWSQKALNALLYPLLAIFQRSAMYQRKKYIKIYIYILYIYSHTIFKQERMRYRRFRLSIYSISCYSHMKITPLIVAEKCRFLFDSQKDSANQTREDAKEDNKVHVIAIVLPQMNMPCQRSFPYRQRCLGHTLMCIACVSMRKSCRTETES